MMFENEQNGIQVTYFTFFMETWEIKAAVFPRENSRGKLVKLYDSSRESAYTTGAGGTRGPGGHFLSPPILEVCTRSKTFFFKRAYVYFFVTRSPDFGPPDGTAIYHGAESGTKLSFQHKKKLVEGSFSTNASIQNIPLKLFYKLGLKRECRDLY